MRRARKNRWVSRLEVALLAGLTPLIGAAPLLGGDGKLEINQDCAATGCFPGDGLGFPVTITSTGSYILTSDLVVTNPNFAGIRIEADCQHPVLPHGLSLHSG